MAFTFNPAKPTCAGCRQAAIFRVASCWASCTRKPAGCSGANAHEHDDPHQRNEGSILARLGNGSGQLPGDLARYILTLTFSDRDKARMHDLAVRNRADALSPPRRKNCWPSVRWATCWPSSNPRPAARWASKPKKHPVLSPYGSDTHPADLARANGRCDTATFRSNSTTGRSRSISSSQECHVMGN